MLRLVAGLAANAALANYQKLVSYSFAGGRGYIEFGTW